ncbi:vWA domain-containing protein [Nonlabens sp.]|uniref:vWA domain-containing protein n=1 Tax=Nonlabens sp. TaxID=1888209 RepID=UPI001BCF4503|nr:vWA domain-containing protein [Nonlabens sp.]
MKNLKTIAFTLSVTALMACKGTAAENGVEIATNGIEIPQTTAAMATVVEEPATIQIALLLDTSNSMDGLIDQAKTQLWDVVNKMSGAHCNEQQALLEIALYEYGNSRLHSEEGFVRQVLSFSTDLDLISKELFSLRTNGGEEYCGTVIGTSLKQLEWKKGKNDLKMIFIAGNEGFNQGTVPFSSSIAQAIEKDVVVNTIFCGDWNTGAQLQWKEGATLGKGQYMNLDHNQKSAYVATPYDDQILNYNHLLNDTYIAFGRQGYENKAVQMHMDEAVQEVSAQANVKRTLAKSSANYRNSSWDLVDALDDEDMKGKVLTEENIKTLPDSIRTKSKKEIAAFAKAKKQERTSIQNKIKELNQKRDQYITTQSLTETNGLESAMFKAIKKQSVSKNFQWE